MKVTIMLVALAATSASPRSPEGSLLKAGSTCYTISNGDKPVGTTLQTITALRDRGKPVWDIVVHQKVGNGAFDMRDHFVVDRKTLLPIRMESQRGKERTERGWHRVAVEYSPRSIRGTKETAVGITSIDVPLTGRVWDGNLWGVTFAALPLREGGTYTLPFWQYDQGFGTFIAHVVGSEPVETPTGKVEAWTVDAGTDPARLLRYRIAKMPRLELGYTAGEHAETIGGACS